MIFYYYQIHMFKWRLLESSGKAIHHLLQIEHYIQEMFKIIIIDLQNTCLIQNSAPTTKSFKKNGTRV